MKKIVLMLLLSAQVMYGAEESEQSSLLFIGKTVPNGVSLQEFQINDIPVVGALVAISVPSLERPTFKYCQIVADKPVEGLVRIRVNEGQIVVMDRVALYHIL